VNKVHFAGSEGAGKFIFPLTRFDLLNQGVCVPASWEQLDVFGPSERQEECV
jgi:hypothetical protein